ncbi:MAG TPA: M20/M25/M40 family metallo-hydrolase [Verrucomicrobiae bacterium]|nr:M20/M25/M40 family metallo-hydrolase [Verrucomicrobiae bacterium]
MATFAFQPAFSQTPYPADSTLALPEVEALVNPRVDVAEATQVAPLETSEKEFVKFLDGKKDEMVALLKEIVEINSGSRNAAGIDAVGKILSERLIKLGFKEELIPAKAETLDVAGERKIETSGPWRILRKAGKGKKALLMGHLDTVFEPESGFLKLVRFAETPEDSAVGPGVADMKGGLVVIVFALEALNQTGLLKNKDVTVFFNGDEETGSKFSQGKMFAEAKRADFCLNFEEGRDVPYGGIVVARKGTAGATITCHGRAAHAGNQHYLGINAALELSQKLLELSKLSDYKRGITASPGVIDLGPFAKSNRVPDFARAEVDFRYLNPADTSYLRAKVEEICRQVYLRNPWTGEEAKTEVEFELGFPPMRPDTARYRWAGEVLALARLLNVPAGVKGSAGGSDASVAALAGCPTLDALGPIGGASHTTDEWVHLNTLLDRAKLTTLILSRIWKKK